MAEPIEQETNSKASYILWLFLLVLFFAIIAAGLLSTQRDLAEAWQEATTRQPETYSALYFDNPARLPGFALAKKPQKVAFHIVNRENAGYLYNYRITETINGKTTASDYYVHLDGGQSAAETLTFTIPKPKGSADVSVTLVGTNERLEFRSKS